jgi:hypothetical protein
MRRGLALAALLLPLSGCYVAPPGPGYGYAQPGYPQPGYGYAQPGYPQAGYPQPGYPPPTDPYGNVYPGYSYNDGAPTLFVDGAVLPLIFFGGAWGYYDGRHEFHRAQAHPAAEPYRGQEQYRPAEQARPAAAAAEPYRGQQQQQYRPAEQARPAATPSYAAPRPAQAAQPAHEERKRECAPGQKC